MNELMKRTAEALRKNGFTVEMFSTGREAADDVLSHIAPGETVGMGGSMTVKELGLYDALGARGQTVFSHWLKPGDRQVYAEAARADVYLASSNAVTTQGQLVNIDRTGNRVAAMLYGPGRVYLLVGCNKLVDGGVPAAIARIRREACPKNARRLGLTTPCAAKGSCNAAVCENSMCGAVCVLEHPTSGHDMTVILIGEPLGY